MTSACILNRFFWHLSETKNAILLDWRYFVFITTCLHVCVCVCVLVLRCYFAKYLSYVKLKDAMMMKRISYIMKSHFILSIQCQWASLPLIFVRVCVCECYWVFMQLLWVRKIPSMDHPNETKLLFQRWNLNIIRTFQSIASNIVIEKWIKYDSLNTFKITVCESSIHTHIHTKTATWKFAHKR